jgi:hypothetical protein
VHKIDFELYVYEFRRRKKMKTAKKIVAMLMLLTLVFSGTAFAVPPTPTEIATATEAGMLWLAGTQDTDGSWGVLYPDKIARTGLALLKFETHALNDPDLDGPFDPGYGYKVNVEAGLEYLFAQVQTTPDGIRFAGGSNRETYATSTALMAIVANGEPDEIVTTGPASGMTYKQVADEIVRYLAYSQKPMGGWDYKADLGTRSDNSISGYATMGLAFAEHIDYNFGCVIPPTVKTKLEAWVNYIQNANGGSGYHQPGYGVNLLKTGNLLQQLAFIGAPVDDTRVVAAIGYIEDHWNDPITHATWGPGWQGTPNGYQATFTLMKGLHGYGIELLDLDGVGDPEFDWFDDVAEKLLADQLVDNSWPQTYLDYESNRILSTSWALLTLQKVSPQYRVNLDIDVKPGSFPNSINLKHKGVMPVAILGSEGFDVSEVDPETVVLTKPGSCVEIVPIRWSMEDSDGDGFMDMIFHFDMEEIAYFLIVPGDTTIELTGNLFDVFGGTPIYGMDSIRTVPKD